MRQCSPEGLTLPQSLLSTFRPCILKILRSLRHLFSSRNINIPISDCVENGQNTDSFLFGRHGKMILQQLAGYRHRGAE